MSHFTDLVGAGKGWRSFLWQVNEHGECVCYRLGTDGKPSAMAAGDAHDVLGGALRAVFPDARVRTQPLSPWPGWYFPGLGLARWRDVAALLNEAKATSRRRAARACHDAGPYFDRPVLLFIGGEEGIYAPTERGLAYDREQDHEAAAHDAAHSGQANGVAGAGA